jgi:ketosteroid isomerase-like protein
MSEENVEIVRRSWENEVSERHTRAKALETFDPDVVWNPVEEGPSYGLDAYLDYNRRWEAPWEDLEMTAEEFIDAGDRVVVRAYLRGRGRGSGVEVDIRFYWLYTLRGGKIVRVDEFTELEEALEAARLEE